MSERRPTKRDLILERSLTLFSSRGFNGVGVEELATAAGVTKPTLYHYFGNKQGLLETLLCERYDPFLDDLAIAATYHRRDLTRSLTNVVTTFLAFGQHEAKLYRMVLAAGMTARDDLATQQMATRLDTQDHLLRTMFAAASEDYGNMAGRHHLAAGSLQGTIFAYLQLGASGEMELDDGAVWRLIQQFSHGIYS